MPSSIWNWPGVRVHELSAGASCGFWWVGEKDSDGVPSALQQEGTPRNYFVLDFDDTRYTLRCKAIGRDATHQMTIHVTGIDTLDTYLRDMKDVPIGLASMRQVVEASACLKRSDGHTSRARHSWHHA